MSKQLYNYHCLHVPSGELLVRTTKAYDLMNLYELLNDWNRSSKGVWVYWL